MRTKSFCQGRLILTAVLMLLLSFPGGARAAEIDCLRQDKKIIFTVPYRRVPQVNALFADRGDQIELRLPLEGLLADSKVMTFDDEWVRAYGLERSSGQAFWFLRKRDPGLQVKSFLALEPGDQVLRIILLKEYRRYRPPATTESDPAAAGKMERLRRLLDQSDEGGNAGQSTAEVDTPPAPSPLLSALRSFLVLLFLSLLIIGLVYFLKRWRRNRLGNDAGLLRVLASEAVTPKHRVMLIDLLGEIMVVGVSGEQMNLLTRITDPERVEELRLLQQTGGPLSGGFGGYLRGLIERSPVGGQPESGSSVAPPPPPESFPAESDIEPDEPLPDSYSDVLSQIKSRLREKGRES